jgi:predicted AlkP superfamily phosphohydrolase/phosphomutase
VAPQLVVLGWDSATFDVIDPLIGEGRLPVLAELQRRGFRAPLRSSWPPMTDCAWTSAFTGTNPGAHGIFGSWYRAPGAYSCRYFSSRDRRAAALWELVPGVRLVVMGVPMTFPPAAVEGAMVATYGAPPGSRFCTPARLQGELVRRWAAEDLMDRAPHASLERFLADLERGARAQSEALVWLTRECAADCVVAVFPQVDRAQHFFWRLRATAHPLAAGVEQAYEALDAATGRVVEAFSDADVMVVSDHGAGPLHGDVNLGAWLARRGRAAYRRAPQWRVANAAWVLPPALRKLGRRVAPRFARRVFGATLAGQLGPFDWGRTDAFVGFHGDLWLNLEGREPAGRVPPARAGELLDELSAGLLGIADPSSGRPAFAAVHRRAEVHWGDAVELAPDAVLDSWSAGYRVAPGRAPSEDIVIPPAPLTGVGEAWSSDHRPLGIFVAAGPRLRRGTAAELSLYDVCPTALALLGQAVPQGLDGHAATEALDGRWLQAHPVVGAPGAPSKASAGEYSQEEADAVAAHLRDLGYIE